jgi:hypothetical protein
VLLLETGPGPVDVVVIIPELELEPVPPVLLPPSLFPELLFPSPPHPAHAAVTVATTAINPNILVLRIISS